MHGYLDKRYALNDYRLGTTVIFYIIEKERVGRNGQGQAAPPLWFPVLDLTSPVPRTYKKYKHLVFGDATYVCFQKSA